MRLPQGKSQLPLDIIIVIVIVVIIVALIPLNSIKSLIGENEAAIKSTLEIIVILVGAITWLRRERNRKRLRIENTPFEIIRPGESKNIEASVFNGDILASSSPYQQGGREGSQDASPRLIDLLRDYRCCLVRGPTGTGKTREIAHFVASQYQAGWTVLIFKGGWLNTPPQWPADIPKHHVLIVLDDLHHHCTPELRPQHPKADEWGGQVPSIKFQDGLEDFLSFLEAPGKNEIRVIGTVRSESEYWSKLDFTHHQVWKRFYIYDLPKLKDETLTHLLETYANQRDVAVDEAAQLIRQSDGMAQTVISNVNNAYSELSKLTLKNWCNSADQTWHQLYQRIIKEVPLASDLYDAAYLVQEGGFQLRAEYVLAVAEERVNSGWFARLTRLKWLTWVHKQGWLERKTLVYCLRKSLQRMTQNYHVWQYDPSEDRLILREGLLEGKADLPALNDNFMAVSEAMIRVYKTTR